jgi:hypothetical protein
MKFEEFENIYVKENKKLRLLMAGTFLILILIIVLILGDKKYFVLKNSKLVNEKPLLTWVCSESFLSISKGTPEKALISDSILNELKKTEFKVSVDEVLNVFEVKTNLCRIIVKGSGKTRSFLINFKSDTNYPFYYKLLEINETELNTDELSKLAEGV